MSEALMTLQLHHLANSGFSYCYHHNTDLHIQWSPKELNSQAAISLVQSTIVMIGTLPTVWNSCEVLIHSIASLLECQWMLIFSHGKGKIVPPVGVIIRVLSYISLHNVSVTLVLPATFWPLLWQRYATMVKEFHYF